MFKGVPCALTDVFVRSGKEEHHVTFLGLCSPRPKLSFNVKLGFILRALFWVHLMEKLKWTSQIFITIEISW